MSTFTSTPGFPAKAVAITKSDSTTYDPPITVYVGGAGNVAIMPAYDPDATPVTFVGLAAGQVVPCLASKVMSTNTTATSLVGIS